MDPSASIFGSLSSGLRFMIRLISDDQMFVDFGVIMGARMIAGWALESLEITHGT